MPPAKPVALFPETVLSVRVSEPLAFSMAPP